MQTYNTAPPRIGRVAPGTKRPQGLIRRAMTKPVQPKPAGMAKPRY